MNKRKKLIVPSDDKVLPDINEPEENTLEWLKAQYDLRKEDIAQKNKILQILLGLVAGLGGVFEVSVCLCEKASYSCVDIMLSAIVFAITISAILCIIHGLRSATDKEFAKWIDRANKLIQIKDFEQYYRERIWYLEGIANGKKHFIKCSAILTIFLGIVSVSSEIVMLILNLAF